TQAGRRPLLLRNDQDTGHAWVRLRLEDPTSPDRHAIGAWVEAEVGGRTLRRQVMPSRSYQSQSELPITLGLGTATALDRLEVRWLDGMVQSVDPSSIALRQTTVIVRGAGG
ncbi:MAG: ASPIC/UnbV domain-containing protein, partial [Holophagales bacterium]|nr:ASPIC/UnbV domain-containing protein [Holophagales bacterium]